MVRLDHGGRAAAEVRLYPAPAPLRHWVQHVSVQHGPARPGPWRVVPDTSAHLIFSMTTTSARCRVVGARSTYADIDVAGRLVTVAVRLHPGALPAFAGVPACELTDRVVDVADLFGAAGRRLAGTLPELAERDAIDWMMHAIAVRVRDRETPVLPQALGRACRVEELQRLLVLPARSLHTRVLRDVGLPPKRALRIARLHGALHRLGSGATLADAAFGAGYSDQAHLTRDARALLGESPAAWLRRAR
jgi:AraC-like DNA-binding protein